MLIGFGTYPLKGSQCEKAVGSALKLGYRMIDTATFYENFLPIKAAISGYKRHEIAITSKVWPDSQTPELLEEDLKNTLKQLDTAYIDDYLLHWPNSRLPIKDVFVTLNYFKEQGLVKRIGLSNVTVNHVRRAFELNAKIDTVQIEMNPLFYDPNLLAYCHENKLILQAWWPLAHGSVMKNELLSRLSNKYKKTNAQISLRWIIQHSAIPLPGSSNEHHQKENLNVFDFSLSEEDMAEINHMASRGTRLRMRESDGFGFSDEFDYAYEDCWPR